MSSIHGKNLNTTSVFDEHQWIIRIRNQLDEELEDDDAVKVSIFCVPKSLLQNNPHSYSPQQVSLGPYHHWRQDLYDMERYKLSAAKRLQKQLKCSKFQDLVRHLIRLKAKIRACYHKYLDFNDDTLAWMMAIDSSFMLEFLQTYAIRKGKVLSRISSRMSHLVDLACHKSAHNVILRDMLMVENQIPLLVLRNILEFQYASIEEADAMSLSMFKGFYKELSPFKGMENLPNIDVHECAHLLDFFYNLIVHKLEYSPPSEITQVDEYTETMHDEENPIQDSSYMKQVFENINKGLKRVLISRPVKALITIPWTFISNFPAFVMLKQTINCMFFNHDKDENQPDNERFNISSQPLVEEITIPSVTELSKSGVHFLATDGNISTINFDYKNVTFHLPCISLDMNTEVILRNLVAYEAANASGPMVFARYIELMNGIIDTEEDVKLLREEGIVLNYLKSDKEAASLWNGMSKSIRLTKVPFIDKVIEDANRYYNGRWTVKLRKFYQHYVIGSGQFLVLLCAILVMLMISSQAFFLMYYYFMRYRTRMIL